DDFIDHNLRLAIGLESDHSPTSHDGALRLLRQNFHAISDSTSPVHRGFQAWNPLDPVAVAQHIAGERQISASAFSQTVGLLKAHYNEFRTGVPTTGRGRLSMIWQGSFAVRAPDIHVDGATL